MAYNFSKIFQHIDHDILRMPENQTLCKFLLYHIVVRLNYTSISIHVYAYFSIMKSLEIRPPFSPIRALIVLMHSALDILMKLSEHVYE